jgi:8-oxo-dGTP pyrophosphatase MutT (NUDIX family)
MISSASAMINLSIHDATRVESSAEALRDALLTPEEASRIEVHGRADAAVLIPMYGHPARPGVVLTERRGDLSRHAGEISFPGGTPDPDDADLVACALREANEEISLAPADVQIVGALPPVPTFVTGYRIHSYVGLIPDDLSFEPSPGEVENILLARLADIAAGYGKRRLVRRGVPIRTDTYLLDGNMIWGATARIVKLLLERVPA